MIFIIGHIKPDLDSAVSAVSFKYLADKYLLKDEQTTAVLASEANYETKTIFNKFNIPLPQVLDKNKVKPEDKFILVDHNEASQRHQAIKDEQIIQIVDHHKISLNLSNPIYATIYPWGSTNTIIWWMMRRYDIKPDKNLAGLMMSAILSDTVGFKSTTTTEIDKSMLDKLNQIAQIKDIDGLIQEILKAKSYIGDLNNKQILTKDYKMYDFSKKKVLIAQLETVEQDKLVNKSQELINELNNLKKEMKVNHAFFVITDIYNINSKAFVLDEDENLLKKAFSKAKKLKYGVYDLGSIMSRKKEIAPPIEKALT